MIPTRARAQACTETMLKLDPKANPNEARAVFRSGQRLIHELLELRQCVLAATLRALWLLRRS